MTAFHEKLPDEGRRILHLHFGRIERRQDARLLTDEHEEMIQAIGARDVQRADALAYTHTRQFRDNSVDFLRKTCTEGVKL
jgi:DNA-binding GntR family transcriptional regulator